MLQALPSTVRDPQQVLIGWGQLVARLVAAYDIELHYTDLAPEWLGEWNSVSNTLLIRDGADLGDQVWLLQQLWNYLSIGEHASDGARRRPMLSLVPQPRQAPDAETA